MRRPVNKQAALGLSFSPAERIFDGRTATQPSGTALEVKKPSVERLREIESRIEARDAAAHLAASKHGITLPPSEEALQSAWAADLKSRLPAIKADDERSYMLLLLWLRRLKIESGSQMIVEVRSRPNRSSKGEVPA